MKTPLNPVQGVNLEDLHQECERSAQLKELLNSVREENLEYLRVALYHQELECQRATPQSAAITKNRIRPSALPPAVAHDTSVAQGCPPERSWHVDNLLGNRTQRIEETEDVHQLFSHQRHRDIKNRQRRRGVDDLVHWVLLDPLLRSGQGSDPVRPGAPELGTVIVVKREVLCAGGRRSLLALGVVLLVWMPTDVLDCQPSPPRCEAIRTASRHSWSLIRALAFRRRSRRPLAPSRRRIIARLPESVSMLGLCQKPLVATGQKQRSSSKTPCCCCFGHS